MPEVSDAELTELRGAHRLLDAVMKNPKTRDKASAILKDLNPQANIPDYDLKVQVGAELKKRDDKIAALEKMITDDKEDAKFRGAFDSAMSKHGITEEARPKVHALMKERNVFDPEAAALLYVNQNPAPQPITSSGWASASAFEPVQKGTEWGDWFTDPEGMRDREIGKFFSERKTA